MEVKRNDRKYGKPISTYDYYAVDFIANSHRNIADGHDKWRYRHNHKIYDV